MPEIRVVNRHREPFDVYIGRGSIWGTPSHWLPTTPTPTAHASYSSTSSTCSRDPS